MSLKDKIYKIYCSNYKLPLTCDLYIGCPGAGKSTLAAIFARRDIKHGVPVWSNFAIKGTYQLDPKQDLGHYHITNGRVLLDEIGLVYNNRKWKDNLSDNTLSWIKLHRHYRVHIDCFSQGLDFDNRFLGIARNVYIVRRSLIPYFVATVKIIKKVGIDKEKHELVDGYFKQFFGTRLYFMPLAWKMFDSYEAPELPVKNWSKY